MELRSEPAHTVWLFPFTPQDWEQTPPAVQAYLHTVRDALGQLQEQEETLEARLTQNSTTSSRPPSSDLPYKKARRRTTSTTPRKAGGKLGPPGPSPGALGAHPRRGGEACAVCVWHHCVCGDPPLLHALGDRAPADPDGGDPLGVAARLVCGLWTLV